jgi:hypothetical protein
LQKTDYWSIYISSLYFVITSFSSIGYGDLKPYTKNEYLFILFMEMIGIGFYGYMLGTIQKLFQDIQNKDPLTEKQQALDNWLIALGKVKCGGNLNYQITNGTRIFFNLKYKWDVNVVQKTYFFEILKPRTQQKVLDTCYQNYYKMFEHAFEGCDIAFKREIIKASRLKVLFGRN